MLSQKSARKKSKYTPNLQNMPTMGRDKMKEENTQGISEETTTKDTLIATERPSKTELLDLRAGIPRQRTLFSRQPTLFPTKTTNNRT